MRPITLPRLLWTLSGVVTIGAMVGLGWLGIGVLSPNPDYSVRVGTVVVVEALVALLLCLLVYALREIVKGVRSGGPRWRRAGGAYLVAGGFSYPLWLLLVRNFTGG